MDNQKHISVTIKGYKDLGCLNNWQGLHDVSWLRENKPEYLKCIEAKHELSHHEYRRWDQIHFCRECKILWHYDDTD